MKQTIYFSKDGEPKCIRAKIFCQLARRKKLDEMELGLLNQAGFKIKFTDKDRN